MSESGWDPWKVTYDGFRSGDLPGVARELERYMSVDERTAFTSLVGLQFSNSSASIIARLNDFLLVCLRDFDVCAVYLEMNGFDINHDRWYFDFFGYDRYSTDPDDLDWLCEWQSAQHPDMTLTGMEIVQRDFDWYHREQIWKDKSYKPLYETALNLVMTKFVLLIEDALRSERLNKPIPVLATAHDFETIARFEPPQN